MALAWADILAQLRLQELERRPPNKILERQILEVHLGWEPHWLDRLVAVHRKRSGASKARRRADCLVGQGCAVECLVKDLSLLKGIVVIETTCADLTATVKALPGRDIRTWAALLQRPSYGTEVQTYLRHRAEVHDTIRAMSLRQKEEMAARYDKGVREVD